MNIGKFCAFGRLAIGFGLLAIGPAYAEPSDVAASPLDEAGPVQIVTQSGARHTFTLELADDEDERKDGLMHRESLAENGGMLFDFGYPQPIKMWMKNTLIPLDMLFVASNGTIVSIAENARPGSLRQIHSGAKVRGVVEIAGGTARSLGIKPGDETVHAIFNNLPPSSETEPSPDGEASESEN